MTQKTYNNLSRVIYMSTVQMLFQSIANSVLGIMSQITEQNGIWWAGPICTLIMFVFSGLGALYNAYIGKIKYRYTFFVGSTGYTVFCACSIAFVYAKSNEGITIVLLACLVNVIGGLILSALYISQFNYISECSIADKQSMYFGLSLGIVQSANIIGNLLSAYIVQPLGQKVYCILMTILIFLISLGYLFIKQVKIAQTQDDIDSKERKNSSEQIIESQTKLDNQSPVVNPAEMYNVMSSFMLLGVVISYVYVFLSLFMLRIYKNDMTPLQLNSLTFKIFIIQGAGEFIGGLTYVFLSQKIPKRVFLLATHKLLTLSVLLMLASLYLKSIYLLGFGAVIAGFVDCCSYSLDLAIVSEENWGKTGYSYFNVLQCGGVAGSILVIMFVNNQIFMCYVLLFQLVSSFYLHNFKSKVATY